MELEGGRISLETTLGPKIQFRSSRSRRLESRSCMLFPFQFLPLKRRPDSIRRVDLIVAAAVVVVVVVVVVGDVFERLH